MFPVSSECRLGEALASFLRLCMGQPRSCLGVGDEDQPKAAVLNLWVLLSQRSPKTIWKHRYLHYDSEQ